MTGTECVQSRLGMPSGPNTSFIATDPNILKVWIRVRRRRFSHCLRDLCLIDLLVTRSCQVGCLVPSMLRSWFELQISAPLTNLAQHIELSRPFEHLEWIPSNIEERNGWFYRLAVIAPIPPQDANALDD